MHSFIQLLFVFEIAKEKWKANKMSPPSKKVQPKAQGLGITNQYRYVAEKQSYHLPSRLVSLIYPQHGRNRQREEGLRDSKRQFDKK